MASRIRNRARIAQLLLALTLTLQSCPPYITPVFADNGQVIGLNNDGVKALNAGNFQLAIQKFEEALNIDKNYQLARDNLAIAHNNFGLQLRNNPTEALKQFHKALYLNRTNGTTLQNVEGIIRIMGLNPKSYQDRVALGDKARLAGDFIGAIIEYGAALQLKDDPKLHIKLGDVYRVRGDDEKAIAEYLLAAKSNDSAEVELKLGQAYGANHDIANAITAYGRAIQFKSDDPDVLDGLVAGWNEALKENPLAPDNHIGLGQALQYRGDWGGAEAEYKAALRLSVGKRNPVAERLLAALPQARAQAETMKHINAGVDAQSRKQYDQAINEYKQALAADANNAATWVNLGTAYQAKEDFDNAMKAYQQALKLDPSNAAANQGVKTASSQLQDKQVSEQWKAGGDLFKQGKYAEAAAKYLAVLKVTPQDATTLYSLGAVYQAMKQIDDAITNYKLAIQIEPKNAQYQKALADALDLKAQPIIQEAVALHKAKNYGAAIDKYQQALAIRPNNPSNAELWYNIATAEYSQVNYNGAKNAYQKALEIDPNGQVADYYYLGLIAENDGKGLEAKTDYQKYLSKAPTGPYAVEAQNRISALGKNIADTQKIKTEAELTALKDSDESFQQAVKLQASSQYDAAIQLYKKSIELQPKNPDFVYSLGTCFQQKGDIPSALACYQQAMSMNSKNKDYQKAYADAMDMQVAPIVDGAIKKQTSGDLAGAIEDYNKALQLQPNNAGAWTNLGTALQQSDKFSEARSAYQKAYDLDKKGQLSDLYLMGAIDENYNQGSKALGEYNQYIMTAGPSGQYTAAAKARVQDLSKNASNVQKLQTTGDVKIAHDAAEAYDKGVKAQQAGNYDEAISDYQAALSLQPKESIYVFAIGTAYQAKGDMTSALANYEKASVMDPSNKQYKDVLKQGKSASAGDLMARAVQLQTSGDVQGAILLYVQGLAITPDNARGWTNLGSAYQQLENWNKARESYAKAVQYDAKVEVDDYYFMGAIDETNNNASLAIQDYQTYIQKSPRGQYAGAAQGRISALRANPASTQKIATHAETQKNADAQTAYDAAVKFQQENKFDEAIDSYNKAIAIAPTEPSYYYGLGTAYQGKSSVDTANTDSLLDKALENYKKAASMNPKEVAYKSAIKMISQAKAAPLVNAAIEKQTTKNDPQGAIVDYQAALRMDPDAGTTHMNYGTALQQVNKTLDAVNEYRRSIQLDAKNCTDAYYYLGTAYEQLKKPLDAIREYQSYLKFAPTGANAKECRERVKLLAPTAHR